MPALLHLVTVCGARCLGKPCACHSSRLRSRLRSHLRSTMLGTREHCRFRRLLGRIQLSAQSMAWSSRLVTARLAKATAIVSTTMPWTSWHSVRSHPSATSLWLYDHLHHRLATSHVEWPLNADDRWAVVSRLSHQRCPQSGHAPLLRLIMTRSWQRRCRPQAARSRMASAPQEPAVVHCRHATVAAHTVYAGVAAVPRAPRVRRGLWRSPPFPPCLAAPHQGPAPHAVATDRGLCQAAAPAHLCPRPVAVVRVQARCQRCPSTLTTTRLGENSKPTWRWFAPAMMFQSHCQAKE